MYSRKIIIQLEHGQRAIQYIFIIHPDTEKTVNLHIFEQNHDTVMFIVANS